MNTTTVLAQPLPHPVGRPNIYRSDFRGLWRCSYCGAYRWWHGEQVSRLEVWFYADDLDHDPEYCPTCRARCRRMVAGVRIPPYVTEVSRTKSARRAGWQIDPGGY